VTGGKVWQGAKHLVAVALAERWGLEAEGVQIDFAEVSAHDGLVL